MLHPHIMPEENSRTAGDNVCRQNREILRRSESSFLKRRFHNLRHEIFSHRFREGVRGFWTFPTSTFPLPLPASHVGIGINVFPRKGLRLTSQEYKIS